MSGYGLKTVPKSLRILMRKLLVDLSCNNCVGVARIVSPHLGVLNACGTERVWYRLLGV